MKKFRGFTLTEAFITMLLLGIIAVVVIPQMLIEDRRQPNRDVLAQKMQGYITQATLEILAFDTSLDDFSRIKSGNEYFSITDVGIEGKMSKLYQKYMSEISLKVDTSHEYFNTEMVDYEKNPLGHTLKDLYTGFFHANDGMLVGFRFYHGCNTTEKYANPPLVREKYEVNNVCGSIFYDINSYSKPNRLGADQFILPFGIKGLEYENH
ncbi:MAG: type II secretion system protein [Candidatus Gastranaerophilales bacterium]|nr:type II secretion system protein [Candidatus Gastranaerophilales bacterium]